MKEKYELLETYPKQPQFTFHRYILMRSRFLLMKCTSMRNGAILLHMNKLFDGYRMQKFLCLFGMAGLKDTMEQMGPCM